MTVISVDHPFAERTTFQLLQDNNAMALIGPLRRELRSVWVGSNLGTECPIVYSKEYFNSIDTYITYFFYPVFLANHFWEKHTLL